MSYLARAQMLGSVQFTAALQVQSPTAFRQLLEAMAASLLLSPSPLDPTDLASPIAADPDMVRQVADEVLVMRDGEVCEIGPAERIFGSPSHPYTRELLAAVPDLEPPAARNSV